MVLLLWVWLLLMVGGLLCCLFVNAVFVGFACLVVC